jgi:uncharacterized repeat protein (TIGR01451 family)
MMAGNGIGEINPVTHVIGRFPTPTASSVPKGITEGPDGNLWFTEGNANQIGQINPATHAFAEFPIPTAGSGPAEITTGPDGKLWFTEYDGNEIGRIDPTTHAITEFNIPTANSGPDGIAVGLDGNLWFTEERGGQIGQINPTTHVITEFPIPTTNSGPVEITNGHDGKLWFTEYNANRIGQMDPTTHVITESPASSQPFGITNGPNGNIWFTEFGADRIGQINPTTRAIAEFTLSPPIGVNRALYRITEGPDGNLWFTEADANQIGQIVLQAPSATADLGVSGTARGSVILGSELTYSLTVTNDGLSGATGVSLTDTLPRGVTFVSATGGVTPANGELSFNIGDLAAGASVNFSIVVTPTEALTLTNQASVSGNESDPTPADNSLTQTTEVATPLTINTFPAPAGPFGITVGPDGDLYFTELNAQRIGRIDPRTHIVTEFSSPTTGQPAEITAGPDGNLWFTESNSNQIGQFNPTTQVVTEYAIPTANSFPNGITAGPDGNIWFCELFANQIGRINPTTHVITEFRTPTSQSTSIGNSGSAPAYITAGPDGNLWFTESGGNKIGRIDPTTLAITEFALPATFYNPSAIARGPDGNIWFVQTGANQIGRINPTSGAVTEFQIPTANSYTVGITGGADGNIWFIESAFHGNQIGRINPTTGVITEFPAVGGPGITTGPDGNLWFTDESGKTIAQVVLSAGKSATTRVTADANPSTVGQAVTFTATVVPTSASGTPTGAVIFSVDGQAQPPVRVAVVNGRGQASFTISSLSAGTHTITADYSGDINFAPGASNPLTQVVSTLPVEGPTVTSLKRFGFHARPTILVLVFDEPLDPASAQNHHDYRIVTVRGSHRAIRIKSALCDAATGTVTLRPVHRLNLHNLFRLTVVGPGTSELTGSSDRLPDSPDTAGHPTSSFVTIISAADLVLTTKNAAVLRKYHKILLEQSAELKRLQAR